MQGFYGTRVLRRRVLRMQELRKGDEESVIAPVTSGNSNNEGDAQAS